LQHNRHISVEEGTLLSLNTGKLTVYQVRKSNTREGDDEENSASPLPLCRERSAAAGRQKLCILEPKLSISYLGPQGTC